MGSERETLPSGIVVWQEVPTFGERRWFASVCAGSTGPQMTRDLAIKEAMGGCMHCGVPPIKNPYAPRNRKSHPPTTTERGE